MSDSLRPHGLRYSRLPCPSLSPGVCSNSCPLSRWCHPTISSFCRPLLLLPSIFPSIRVFSKESALRIRWPKYWSFSFNISPSNEQPGLISFRMDWLDLLAVQGTLKSLLQHHKWRWIYPCVPCVLSRIWLFVAPWTVACQASLSMEFSREVYSSGWPFATPMFI